MVARHYDDILELPHHVSATCQRIQGRNAVDDSMVKCSVRRAQNRI